MKKLKPLILTCLVSSSVVQAETILYRGPGVSLPEYRKTLQTSLSLVTPMQQLEDRLRSSDLSPALQKEMQTSLNLAAQTPDRADQIFEQLLSRLDQEPRSKAVRDARQMVLERLTQSGSRGVREKAKERLILISDADEGSGGSGNLKPNLEQKEIQARLRVLRSQGGGEDLQIFRNGQAWSEMSDAGAADDTQWILISSGWQPRVVTGSWNQISGGLEHGFSNWIEGSCQSPQFHDYGAASASKKALFPDQCLAGSDELNPWSADHELQSTASSQSKAFVKPLLWTAAVLAVGALILSVSGKRIEFKY